MHHHSFRSVEYLQWDGSLEAPLSPDDLMDAISEDIMRDGNLDLSLQRAFRWGSPGAGGPGLNDLLDRLRQQRQELLDQFDFGSSLDAIRERLDDILRRETNTIHERRDQLGKHQGLETEDVQRLSEYLDLREQTLRQLPERTAPRIEHLKDYEFVDAQAGQDFDDLVQQMQQQVTDALFNNLMGSLPQKGDGSAGQMQEFLQDLNEAFEQERLGQQPDMDKLNNKWANQLGGRAEDMNEIRERLRSRMQAAQTFMAMLSPQQRAQMQEMIEQSLQGSGLMDLFQQLQAYLGPISQPSLEQSAMHGEQDIPLDIAMQVLEQASRMDQLESQIRSVHRPQELRGLDQDLIDQVLTGEDQEWLERWSGIEDQLIDAGFVRKGRRGLEFTPKAVRRIGEKALEDIYSSLRNKGIGEHDVQRQGAAGEPTAHIERGEVRCQYPPTLETFEATLREVVRCTREDITINTFLLESTPHMLSLIHISEPTRRTPISYA